MIMNSSGVVTVIVKLHVDGEFILGLIQSGTIYSIIRSCSLYIQQYYMSYVYSEKLLMDRGTVRNM
jgi:hypothetical protein